MSWNLNHTLIQAGDLVQLVGLRHKNVIIQATPGASFQSHRGVLQHDDLIGLPWGSQVYSHNGSPFFLLQPALADLLRTIRRNTQILYPKEIGFILVSLGIGPGQHVVEAGTGSGALTAALAYAVGPAGKVSSIEIRPEMQSLAKANLERFGLLDRVDLISGDIGQGFGVNNADALFLDVVNPYDYIQQVRGALKLGGFFGSIVPTTNQVTRLLVALRQNDFAFIDVCEIMLRYYKAEPDRFRPTDRMIAHTGYLIFARPILPMPREPLNAELLESGIIIQEDTEFSLTSNETE